MAMASPPRPRRKPAPAVLPEDVADGGDHLCALPARNSFALYALPPPPLSPTPSPAVSVRQTSPGATPHYTRRRTQSSADVSAALPASASARTKLTRLFLPQAPSVRIRKHTISSPPPAEFPLVLVPPGLEVYTAAHPPMLHALAPVVSATASSSSSSSTSTAISVYSASTSSTSVPTSPVATSSGVRVPFGALLRAEEGQCTLVASRDATPHCTHRRTQSVVSVSVPASVSVRTKLARLLLPQAPSTRIRKETISGPLPVAFPPALIPPGLEAYAGARRLHALTPVVSAPASCSSLSTTSGSLDSTTTRSASPASPVVLCMISKPPPRKTPKPAPHAPDTLPTPAALARAAALPVVASSGVRVPFGALLRAEEGQRTLVVFLRHFWCPLCQDYMVALGLALRAAASAPSSRSTSMSAPPSIPMPIPPTPPCISTLTSTTPTSTPSTPVTHTTPTPAATSPCACPAESGSESVTLSYLDSLAFASPSPSPAASVSSSPSPSASPSISPAPAPAPSPSPTPAEPPQTESPRAPAPDCGTHLLLIAPGSHTLIARYLSAFDFPPSAPPPHSVSLPDTSPTSPKKFKPDFNFDLGDPCPPAPPSPLLEGEGGVLKSVRMYVDPAPATGVYAALGMGWAGGVEGEGESDSPPTATADTHDERANPASYVAHSTLAGIGAVVLRALRSGMPLWARGGDVRLLGGEFVFEAAEEGSVRCTYAHRMQTSRGHAATTSVLAAAGLVVPPSPPSLPSLPAPLPSPILSPIPLAPLSKRTSIHATSRLSNAPALPALAKAASLPALSALWSDTWGPGLGAAADDRRPLSASLSASSGSLSSVRSDEHAAFVSDEEGDDAGNDADVETDADGAGESAWLVARARSLARLQARKDARRWGGGVYGWSGGGGTCAEEEDVREEEEGGGASTVSLVVGECGG